MSQTLVITNTYEERNIFIQLLRNEPDRVARPSNDKPYAYFVLDDDKYDFGLQDARTAEKLNNFITSYHPNAECIWIYDYIAAFPPVMMNINMSFATLYDFI